MVCCVESAQVRLTRKAASEARQAGKAQELETALREASSLFKAEMAVKAAELHALHAELGCAVTSRAPEVPCRVCCPPVLQTYARPGKPSRPVWFALLYSCFPFCQLEFIVQACKGFEKGDGR